MLTRSPGDDRLAALVNVVVKVAQMHGSTVPLSDLVRLLPDGTTSEEIAGVFEVLPPLSGNYALKDGLVVPRSANGLPSNDFNLRIRHSIANTQVARWLTNALGNREALIVAVSGSTSYNAASPRDDVDLFCVTRPHTMWLFLARALLLTRASRIFRRPSIPIDLSCLMDEDYAAKFFARDGGALIARDALVAEVVRGQSKYASLLDSAPWMKRYFPKLYETRSTTTGTQKNARSNSSNWERCVNLFLFTTLGSYIRAKAIFHNHVLATEGKSLSAFHARAGPDHLIYESAKYDRLKEIYEGINPMPKEAKMNSRPDELAPSLPNEHEPR
ncbi:MAG TPA: hypothetical protein VGR53_09420 [Nitrososphaerales archaeon]|nr:hypothetical protein [Nitrososphaerales archaeon]